MLTAVGDSCIPLETLHCTDAARFHFCLNCMLPKNPESGRSIKEPTFCPVMYVSLLKYLWYARWAVDTAMLQGVI